MALSQRSGRPKDVAKREAIIKAARDLFATQPFEQVTMEAVALRAGVSKMTVYSHFHDKEMLFETIVLATSDQMIGTLTAPESGGGLRERLIAVGTVVLGVLLGTDICTMAHTLPGALRDNRPLAERFYAAGPGRVRAALAAIIAEAAQRGELTVDDPTERPTIWSACGKAACRRRSPLGWSAEHAGGDQPARDAGDGGVPAGVPVIRCRTRC